MPLNPEFRTVFPLLGVLKTVLNLLNISKLNSFRTVTRMPSEQIISLAVRNIGFVLSFDTEQIIVGAPLVPGLDLQGRGALQRPYLLT